MKIRKVEVSIGVTINTGNYTSVKLMEGVTVEVEDGEKPSVIINKARTFLEEKIHEDAITVAKSLKTKGLVG